MTVFLGILIAIALLVTGFLALTGAWQPLAIVIALIVLWEVIHATMIEPDRCAEQSSVVNYYDEECS